MLYDLDHTAHRLRMDALRREAEHERLVRQARGGRRERNSGAPRRFRLHRGGQRGEGEQTAWAQAA